MAQRMFVEEPGYLGFSVKFIIQHRGRPIVLIKWTVHTKLKFLN